MALLANGIPLSLLLDLACGPESADLLAQEHAAGNLLPFPASPPWALPPSREGVLHFQARRQSQA